MKKIINLIISLIFANPVYADTAKLQVKISDAPHGYYLCVSHTGGCVSLSNAFQGKTIPLSPGKINNMIIMSLDTRTAMAQPISHSCNVSIEDDQTVIITGKILNDAIHPMQIQHLECHIKHTSQREI